MCISSTEKKQQTILLLLLNFPAWKCNSFQTLVSHLLVWSIKVTLFSLKNTQLNKTPDESNVIANPWLTKPREAISFLFQHLTLAKLRTFILTSAIIPWPIVCDRTLQASHRNKSQNLHVPLVSAVDSDIVGFLPLRNRKIAWCQ